MQTLDIVVPVHNEEKTLDIIKNKIDKTDYCGLQKRIIFVNDCSTDNSREILEGYKDSVVINHEVNQGKGAALATGLRASTADYVVIQDADLEYNTEDYQKLLSVLMNNESCVCYGSRLKDKTQRKSFLFLSYMANNFLTFLTNILYGCKITDMETCYKAFKKEALDGIVIKSKKFEFEVEITAKMIKKGYKINEVPISYNGRTWEDGKKITGFDALHAIFALFYYRFFD